MFSTLREVRSLAAARSIEDYEYFCSYVLGPHCRLLEPQRRRLWEDVVQGQQVDECPSETFSWLFGQLLRRAA